ncbi:MAG TPA: hypothetical protein PKC39_08615 [Ferruginibacter sp.]|nr:hypothetical protein [Ferruginibacter sp.]HMP21006.1 hypothetical protein [Ferruginibacter sp.]
MKKLFKTLTTLLLTLVLVPALAQKETKKKYDYTKERTIAKTYTAAGNTLKIDNSFGNITVSTWNKNEIKVDIYITVSATNEEYANDLFEIIQVSDKQEGKTISFKTSVNKNRKGCKHCSSNMEINYNIQIPTSNALEIENSFGTIRLPDYNGPLSVVSKFGALNTGALARVEKIQVEFGSAAIKSMGNIDAVFKFSTLTIDKLTGSNKIKIEFCSSNKIGIDNSLTELVLSESYSTVNLKTANDFSATYSIKTNFSTVKDRSNANLKRTDHPSEYGPDNKKEYEGKSGSGAAKINIKSSFGKIIIGEATEDDFKKKKEKKTTTV